MGWWGGSRSRDLEKGVRDDADVWLVGGEVEGANDRLGSAGGQGQGEDHVHHLIFDADLLDFHGGEGFLGHGGCAVGFTHDAPFFDDDGVGKEYVKLAEDFEAGFLEFAGEDEDGGEIVVGGGDVDLARPLVAFDQAGEEAGEFWRDVAAFQLLFELNFVGLGDENLPGR